MLYVGLDVHAKQVTICVLNDNGQVHLRHQVRQVDQLMRFLERLPKPWRVCYEASTGYGFWFELFQPLAERVVVAHPGLLRLIFRSKKKNDRADAEKLAKLLYLGEVPAVHVPTADVRAWRELITFRRRLVEKRTRAKNGIRCLLRSVGVTAPKRPGLWTKQGLLWLTALEFAQPLHALKRDMLLEELESYSQRIARVEKELAKFSQDNLSVWLLRSIPGVGPRTAEAVVAFIDNPHRFDSSKQVGSYFGLVPLQDQSGDSNRLGHITRDGSPTVRQLLVEAAWTAIRRSPTVKAYFDRIHRDEQGRKKIAVVATAHYLVRVMWSMLKHGKLWQETVQAQAA